MTYPIGAGQAYYTVVRIRGKTIPLTGPHPSHATAGADLDRARHLVADQWPADREADFGDWGVALVTGPVSCVFDNEPTDTDTALPQPHRR